MTSHGDSLRKQVSQILNELELAIKALADSTRELDEVNGGVLLLGMAQEHPGIGGTVAMGMQAKTKAGEYADALFELRQRLTLYQRGLY
jgi:hypothetical protein